MTKGWAALGRALVLVLAVAGGAAARPAGGAGAYALEEGERNLKFAGLPVPGYSEVLGFNLGVVGMAYYKMDRHDDELPPSVTGLFGFYSENNSWLGAAFQSLHLDHDRWRVMAALGTGSFKYEFNPGSAGPGFPDVFLDYTTGTKFVFAQGSRRVWGDLFLGLGALSWAAQVSVEPELVDLEEERYTGPGLVGEWDRRDHVMYPTAGYDLKGRYLIYAEALGSERAFRTLSLGLAGYRALGDSTRVLAGRLLTETGFGDVPFSAQNILSGQRNLRGYADGRHRGEQLVVVEAEYRWNFHGRWGAVAFGGLGWVADELDRLALDDTLPAAGLGVRFRLIETYRINARIDYGWGDHDQAVYFAIGEAY